MQTLIELGADVNAKDLSTGKTPIMYTSDWKEQEETKLLIKNNANIYLTDKNNKSCLDYLDEPNKKIVLCKDVLNGISNGNIEPNAKNSCGDPPLIVYGDLAASAFIKAGADVNIQGEYGKTALMTIKNPEAIKDVIAAGANIEAKDNYGNTAFNCAINNVEKAKLLIEAGANVNDTDDAGHTALMYAVSQNKTSTASVLTDMGADVKARDASGNNAMDYAQTAEMKSVLAAASVRQTKREKEAQTQTQAAPTRQTQVNMNVAARTQGGR